VLSANLWHDWPRHRRLPERLEALARLVEGENVDVVLLQEVARMPSMHADEWLAERLGMSAVYSRANGDAEAIGFEEGLAVLSRYPLSEPRARPLRPSLTAFVRRMALGVEVLSPCGPLTAYSVHLGLLPGVNADQLDHLRLWVSLGPVGRPAFIGGDFNANEDTPQMRRARGSWMDVFRHLHPHADGTTHELHWPWGAALKRSRLDYLFLQPGVHRWQVLEARHLTSDSQPHSDHRAVLARLAPQT
jgi:endonuclease/exonuclease/phosphatase family metal-dependent hydrolase